ncbi:MAG: phosphoglucomutase, alpha-D-glucose phosphate-specific [Planctomycetaceae bacterium]|nr:MAG: phosphoglucomutase, alpha-D-glucose phosphate-specific [Planctomycetaceae bacterium]
MSHHPLAGQPAPPEMLVDVERLRRDYFELHPNPEDPHERVGFGTSGHRGTSSQRTFNEAHILAITQAVCEYRKQHGIHGPLFIGRDTHALSEVAEQTALEVLQAQGVTTIRQHAGQPVPTPVISHAILCHNQAHPEDLADGIVITPSHNPPQDGGFKYNPPHGGPADTQVTKVIQQRANELLRAGVHLIPRESSPRGTSMLKEQDLIGHYVQDLGDVVNLEAIRSAGIKLGVDPLGGASLMCWDRIADIWKLHISVVNRTIDPQFGFMPLDHDGVIRMDCSSPWAMAGLLALKDRFDIACGCDPDADRHGIVTRGHGLMNPNHYLAVAIWYLFQHRPQWPAELAVGKTLVSSVLIDRVVSALSRRLYEVPVGFKWFVEGLHQGWLGFGGEESAGASFLRHRGTTWSTDKDGIIMGLLAAEMLAVTNQQPDTIFNHLTSQFGMPFYTRLDRPATPEQKDRLKSLSPTAIQSTHLAGEPILQAITRAPGNQAEIGGLKVVTTSGWFAARPSGTENVYKIYAESLRSAEHLQQLVEEAQVLVSRVLS